MFFSLSALSFIDIDLFFLHAQYERTALMWAARNGHVESVLMLIELGAEKEAKNIVRVRHMITI